MQKARLRGGISIKKKTKEEKLGNDETYIDNDSVKSNDFIRMLWIIVNNISRQDRVSGL